MVEVVQLHGVPKTITFDRNVKFTDGQTEVVNRSLGNLLRSLVGENSRQWDLVLPQAEFAYNRSKSRTTGKTTFEVVTGVNPITPLDLTLLLILNAKYKERVDRHRKKVVFKEGDLVWIRLGKESFPTGRFGKLQPRADGPYHVLKRINDNAYKIDLPGEYHVSATFNVADLSPYVTDEEDSKGEEADVQ
ncbi:RNA-directed DNA polymerase [Tanacetum coccineum]